MSKNVVFLPAIVVEGNESRSAPYKYGIDSWKKWCDKNNVELFILDQLIYPIDYMKITWQRYMIHELLEANNIEYDQVLMMDCDSIIHPDTPNFFKHTERKYVGVLDLGCWEWTGRSIRHYKDLFDFWNCLLKDPEAVFQAAKCLMPIDEDLFYLMQTNLSENDEWFTKAAMFFAINRSTAHGTVSYGKMQKNHPHFNEHSLRLLRNFNAKNLQVFYEPNYTNIIDNSDDIILCCPPTYISMPGLTGGPVPHPENKNIDHSNLCELLSTKNKWILFLNYHEDLIKMYESFNIIFINKFYNKTEDDPQYILVTNGV